MSLITLIEAFVASYIIGYCLCEAILKPIAVYQTRRHLPRIYNMITKALLGTGRGDKAEKFLEKASGENWGKD